MSNCPHCNRATFEIEEFEVSGVKFKLVNARDARRRLESWSTTTLANLSMTWSKG
jgi:hypothetical protein